MSKGWRLAYLAVYTYVACSLVYDVAMLGAVAWCWPRAVWTSLLIAAMVQCLRTTTVTTEADWRWFRRWWHWQCAGNNFRAVCRRCGSTGQLHYVGHGCWRFLPCLLLLLAGCSDPTPRENDKLKSEMQSGRVRVVSAQFIQDARGDSRDILVLLDTATSNEYLAVMGAGVQQMRYHSTGKSGYYREE